MTVPLFRQRLVEPVQLETFSGHTVKKLGCICDQTGRTPEPLDYFIFSEQQFNDPIINHYFAIHLLESLIHKWFVYM